MGYVSVSVLCVFLFGAGWTDLCVGKVRNWWIAAGILAGIYLRGKAFLLPFLAVLVPAFLLFSMGMLGAGDGKVMALIAGYLGMRQGLGAISVGMMAGGLWSLYRLWCGKDGMERLFNLYVWFRRLIQTKEWKVYCDFSQKSRVEGIPLAACMAAGTYLYLFCSCAAAIGRM